MAVCPKCNSTNVKFSREAKGSTYHSSYKRTGVKSSWFIPAGMRDGKRNIKYDTVAVCQNCGNTWCVAQKGEILVGKIVGGFLIFSVVLGIITSILGNGNSTGVNQSGGQTNHSVWLSGNTDIEDFKYKTDGLSIYIEEYNGSSKQVRIAGTYEVDGKEMTVESLDGTFALDDVDSVIVPEGVTKLSDNCFNSCGIQFLYLPSTLKEFKGWSYFHDIKKLYYGGTEEEWAALLNGANFEFEVVCNASADDLK